MKNNKLREALAAYSHDIAWAGWMKYFKSNCSISEEGEHVFLMLDKATWDKWEMQMNTPYADLPEEMKPSDRDQADHILRVLEEEGVL